MFIAPDPNMVVMGGPGSNPHLNRFWNFIPDTKKYLRMTKLEKIYKFGKWVAKK